MIFTYLIAFLLIVVLTVLLYPLWRFQSRPILMGEASLANEATTCRLLEKESCLRTLSQLEIDHAQEKLDSDDYQRLKQTEEHRLLTLLDASQPTDNPTVAHAPAAKRRWGLIIAIGIWIVAGSVGVSSFVHQKISRDQMAAFENSGPAQGMPPIDPEKMVARLEARLKENPNDINGQMMLGRSYIVLQRWVEAKATWEKVLEMDERNSTAHVSIGEILLRSNEPGNKTVAAEALTHFDKALISAPQDPSILWARGISLIALGRFAEADEAWTTAYQAVSPGTQEATMLKSALEALRSGQIQSP
jgi:cytochrome c-type biogenesis protein CcmH